MAAKASPTQMLMSILATHELDAIIIDHDDPHSTETPHPAFGALEFVSNFSGSWGKAVVSKEHAWLWTDSRWVRAYGCSIVF